MPVKEGEELPILITAARAVDNRDSAVLDKCAGKLNALAQAATDLQKGDYGAAHRRVDKLIQEASVKEALKEVERQQKLEEDPEETAYSKLVARQSLEKKSRN